MTHFDDMSADDISDILNSIEEPTAPLPPNTRIAGNNDFEAIAITPKKHIAYAKARNDPNLKLGQFPLMLKSIGRYNIVAIENMRVSYGVGDISENEMLTAAERAYPDRCQIPNIETRVLEVLEPTCNPVTNSVNWIVKFPTISSKAIYGPTGGRKLKICGVLKCQDTTDGAMCLVKVQVATVAIRITTKESEAKGIRKRKYDSAYGPSCASPTINDLSFNEADETAATIPQTYQDLLLRVTQLEALVGQLMSHRVETQI